MTEENIVEKTIIEKRKEKLMKIFNDQYWLIIIFLIAIVILGVYIRSMPMQDHNGRPGLWDVAKGSWTLGPDLDPWLFERTAKEIILNGGLAKMDMMRNIPFGLDPLKETVLLPYMIVWTYKIVNLFGSYPIEFAADLLPVIMFALTIISFFFFVREVFISEEKEKKIKAFIIAAISTIFFTVIPAFLSRTVAGIPEKESAGFFFMFLAFYLMIKAWKAHKTKNAVIFAILTALTTCAMELIWGGVIYVYITIGVSALGLFLIGKVEKKEFLSYAVWLILANILFLIFSRRESFSGIFTSLDTGLCYVVLFTLGVHFILFKTKIGKHEKIESRLKKLKLPNTIVSFIISIILIIILASILLGPSFIIEKLKVIHQTIFQPIIGRWNTTVAENRQPYFTEWSQSFGPYLKNIPVFFWLFFLGSILLFKKMVSGLKKKDSWILTGFYVLLFFGMVFSRYAEHPALLDGDGLASKSLYYGAVLLFLIGFGYYYSKYNREGKEGFDKIEFPYFLTFILFMLTLFTARGAIRLIMVLASVAPIMVGFLLVDLYNRFKESKDEILKVLFGCLLLLTIGLSIFSAASYYQEIKAEAYSYVPGYYNQQWQYAMAWVRNNTDTNAVFAHWWDYGYWLQSIGERPTVLDGGNSIVFWNYWMGRLVLTGDNQKDSLDFLYAHNASYLLIDSSDIGKYGAFSSIGSDKDYDRFSWIGTYLIDERQTQETSNQTIYVYSGQTVIDENLIINTSDGKEVLLPMQKAGVIGILVPRTTVANKSSYDQPIAVFVYQGKQYQEKLRYLDINGEFIDYKSGLEACAFVFPSISTTGGNGVTKNNIGAMMYISPRLLRGYLAQKYILNDPFNKFPNFKLAHDEPNLIIDSLNSQGMNLPDFVYFQGVQGPIKIWKIEYAGNETVQQKYLDTDSTKYLDWKL